MGKRGPGAKPVRTSLGAQPRPYHPPAKPRQGVATRADRAAAWIERLVVPGGAHAGRGIVLRPWQRDILRAVYATDAAGHRPVRQVLVSMARKNGKSALAAMLAAVHLAGPESIRYGQVYAAAADREQASVIFRELVALILADEELRDTCIIRDFARSIEHVPTGSMFRALPADSRKAHGLSPSCYIADEVAQWRSRHLLDALQTGQGAHSEPLGIVISTRSPDPDNPLEELLRHHERVQAGIIQDPAFAGFVWTAPQDLDPWDEATWALANPALGDFRSIEDVRVLAGKAQHIPSQEAAFRAYVLNQAVAAEARWIAAPDWDSCAGDGTEAADGVCFLGLDLSSGASDLTAVSAYWPATGLLRCWGFIPADAMASKERADRAPYAAWQAAGHVIAIPGRAIDRAWLGLWLAEQFDGAELAGIGCDRWGMTDLETSWRREGLDHLADLLRPIGQGYRDMSPLLQTFEAAVLDRKIAHGSNPLLRMAVANAAVTTDPAGGRKLDKSRATGRIDPAIASIEAVGLAARAEAVPEYLFTGLLTL